MIVQSARKEHYMLGTILIVILVLALLGALPRWSHSRDWGYYPTGGVGVVLFVIVILLLLGRI
jgi:low affinity Fe/Cu permease